jgi:hypothetical protein
MLPWILTAWIAAHGADIAGGEHARARGAHEIILPNNPLVINAIVTGEAVGGALVIRYLWTHGHRRMAVTVAGIGVAAHGWAGWHNFKVK